MDGSYYQTATLPLMFWLVMLVMGMQTVAALSRRHTPWGMPCLVVAPRAPWQWRLRRSGTHASGAQHSLMRRERYSSSSARRASSIDGVW